MFPAVRGKREMRGFHRPSFVERVLHALAELVIKNPRKFFAAHAVLLVASLWITVTGLEFSTNRNDLVGSDKRYHQNFLRLNKEFPLQDDLVVVVESEDSEKNRQFVERLGAKLNQETNLFRNVFFKGDLRMLGSKALLLIPEEDLATLLERLKEYGPFINQFSHVSNLVTLFEMVNTQFRTARKDPEGSGLALVQAIPVLDRLVQQAEASMDRPGVPPSPGMEAFFGAGEPAEQSSYIAYANGTLYLATAQAPSKDLNGPAVERLRELIEETRREVPGVNVGLTGEPVLEIDEMDQSRKDSIRASVVSLFLCALIFVYGYNETGRPIKATICLVVGLAYTIGFTTLAVGHLNILTVTFVPILIGLAIDFGVHLVTRYEEELRHGQTEAESLTRAMVHTGKGIFTGAFTTAGAFLAMAFTEFKGIQEMGIICGGGLIVCLLPMMTLLPVLLLRGRQNVIDHAIAERVEPRARIEQIWMRRPWIVVGVVGAITAFAVIQSRDVRMDYNLLNMQTKNLPAVEFEHKLITSTPKSVLFAAVVTDSPEEAQAMQERLLKLPSVASIDSISPYLVEDPTAKLRLIRDIKKTVQGIRFADPDLSRVRTSDLTRTLYSLNGYIGLALPDIPPSEAAVSNQLAALRFHIEDFRKGILQGPPDERDRRARRLGAFQRALFRDVQDSFKAMAEQRDDGGLTVEDLSSPLRERFVGVTGKHLLLVYPKKDVWQRENQREFVAELRTVDPDVTGGPVQLFEYTSLLVESYKEAAWYALAAICVLALIHFRNPLTVLLALVPMGVGFTWMCGVMGFHGIPFNPANIMTLPLIIGIGVTNGIHILNRFSEEKNPSILAKSTGKAVLVSGMTTMAGFGSLILADHQGIRSLGQVMAIGVGTCMLASITFLPALLKILGGQRSKTKINPVPAKKTATLGREEPR